MRYRQTAIFTLAALTAVRVNAAEFIPFYLTIELAPRQTHWLARGFADQVKRKRSCAEQLTAGNRWLSHRLFDRPEKDFGILFQLSEGGYISNKTPTDYHFSFPPKVFSEMGGRLFEHYGHKQPVTSIALIHPQWENPFSNWTGLFEQTDLVAHFGKTKNLEVSAEALPALSQSTRFGNLESLSVAPTEISPLVSVLNSTRFPRLRRLNLDSADLSAEDLQSLLRAPGFAAISEISFRHVNFGDAGFVVLAASPALARLEALDIDAGTSHLCENRPTYSGMKQLFASPQLTSLKRLSIQSVWEFDPAAINVVQNWSGLSQLEYLDLQAAGDSGAVAELLSRGNFRQLRELQLRGTDYRDDVLLALAGNPTLGNLERVAIDLNPKISPESVRAVVKAKHLSRTIIGYDMKALAY